MSSDPPLAVLVARRVGCLGRGWVLAVAVSEPRAVQDAAVLLGQPAPHPYRLVPAEAKLQFQARVRREASRACLAGELGVARPGRRVLVRPWMSTVAEHDFRDYRPGHMSVPFQRIEGGF